jgi:anti-sigma regulatory factor (Ser/Thr protein kinase)
MTERQASDPPSAAPSALRASAERHRYLAKVTVPNRIEAVRPTAGFLVQTARALNVAAASSPLFEVAVSEALTNAVKHGHGRGERGERGTIICELELDPAQLTIRIEDEGPGFTIPARRVPEMGAGHVEALAESGYGLPIMQSIFPVVRGLRINRGFMVELILPLR